MQYIKHAIPKLIAGKDLSKDETFLIADEIMSGLATQSQMGAFLIALRMKGETVEEITGFALAMRSKSERIVPKTFPDTPLLTDLCGTGGDALKTFNISTMSSFVVAGAGVPVAKHGNRSVTSKCGSADLLEKLGVNIRATPEQVEKSIETSGIGFMFAQTFHPAIKHASPVRSEIGVRTIFNILGPLTNPARARSQLLGVYDASLVPKIVHVLRELGVESALVVHGEGGLDEISTFGGTIAARLSQGGKISEAQIKPSDFGLEVADYDLVVAPDNVEEYASMALRLLSGQAKLAKNESAILDMILANSAAAIMVSGRAMDYLEGMAIARESIANGMAIEKLSALVKHSGGDMRVIESFLMRA